MTPEKGAISVNFDELREKKKDRLPEILIFYRRGLIAVDGNKTLQNELQNLTDELLLTQDINQESALTIGSLFLLEKMALITKEERRAHIENIYRNKPEEAIDKIAEKFTPIRGRIDRLNKV